MAMIEKKSEAWTMVIAPESGAKLLQIYRADRPFLWNARFPGTEAWCVGGERTWIAPEYGGHGFFSPEDTGASAVPSVLDPGYYVQLDETDESACFENRLRLHSRDGEVFEIAIRRTMEIISAEEDRASFRITSKLVNLGTHTFAYPIGLWELLQVPAVPLAVCRVGTRASPVLGNCIHPGTIEPLCSGDGFAVVPALPELETKLGLKARDTDGILEYHDRGSLYSLHFRMVVPPDPSLDYADKPARPPEAEGDAVQVYSSGASIADPFCELELHAPSVQLAPGATSAFCVDLCCFDEVAYV
jgi:hypothetical protein